MLSSFLFFHFLFLVFYLLFWVVEFVSLQCPMTTDKSEIENRK